MKDQFKDNNGQVLCGHCFAILQEASSIAIHDFNTWTWKFKTTYQPCECQQEEEEIA